MRVGPAPEPSDVVWENLEFSLMQRLQRRCFILILNLLIIAVGLLLPVCLKYLLRILLYMSIYLSIYG